MLDRISSKLFTFTAWQRKQNYLPIQINALKLFNLIQVASVMLAVN